jgi:hypothetical protein
MNMGAGPHATTQDFCLDPWQVSTFKNLVYFLIKFQNLKTGLFIVFVIPLKNYYYHKSNILKARPKVHLNWFFEFTQNNLINK